MKKMPWESLVSEGWSIVGMNHYNLKGKRYLFCAMAKDGLCIKSENVNEGEVFSDLEQQAMVIYFKEKKEA